MKRFVCKAVAIIFGGVLLVTGPVAAGANGMEQPKKEEVVYVKLQTDGTVEAGYVVNSFELKKETSFTDYGDYENAINLSTLDPLDVVNGAVNINASEGTFYYQGNLQSPELPWSVSIRYLLNGTPVTAKQVAGASGRLKIELSITDNPNAKSVFTENYALQIGITLNGQTCSNIYASGATIASSGQEKQVNFIRMPGSDGSTQHSVSMTVTGFEMDGIRIAGIPFSIDVNMPDTDEVLDDLTELSEGIAQLHYGALDLSGGGALLQDGYDQFHNGLVQMQAALDEMNAGLSQLVSGNPELEEALNQIEQALLAIQASLAEFGGTTADLEDLVTGSAQVLEGLDQLSAGLAQMQQSFELTDQAVYEMTGHAYEGLQEANEATIASLNQQIADLTAADPVGNAAQIEQLTIIVGLLGANNELVTGLKTGVNGDGTPQNPGLAYAASTLATQYQQIDEAIAQLPTMLGEMLDGILQLKAGVDELAPSFSLVKDGLIEYLGGTLAIEQGFNALCSGFGDVVAGSNDLKINIALLSSGLQEFAQGTGKLHNETWNMDEQFRAKIDEMLLEYTSGSFEVVSFASENNTNVDSVQFVMMTEGIQIPEAEPAPEAEPETKTFWQRFLYLFGL